MADIKETIANTRKRRQDQSGSPTFVSGDVADGTVREAEVEEEAEKAENDQQND